ncbi:MAG: phosphomannomutase/phosphoglucomutase, partial [Fervidobacterium sp.]
GMDMRLSSKSLKESFISGLTSTGCNVIDIGMVPTPVSYFAIINLEKKAGASITASHNPPQWNGFKLRGKNAIGLTYGNGLEKIEKIFLSKNFLRTKNRGIVTQKDVKKAYINKIYGKINMEKKLKVVIDVGNGMGGIAETIYRDLGCDVDTLFKEPDGRFPNHIPDPYETENMKTLSKIVVKERADVGIAFDADCDRVGFVDNRGRIIQSDVALSIFAMEILSSHKNPTIICDIRTPVNVIKEIENLNGNVIVTRAGSGFIMKKMIENEAIFGGEMSGHFWFGNSWFNIDDGIFAGAKMLEIISKSKKSFASIVDETPHNYFVLRKRMFCSENKKQKLIDKLIEKFEQKHNILTIDGVKIIEEDWSLLVRPSRTEPQIEIVVESKKNNVSKILKKFEAICKESV